MIFYYWFKHYNFHIQNYFFQIISLSVLNIFFWKVKWAKENYHHDLGNPYSLRLASGDTSGVIIVWDVTAGVAKSEFSEGNKPIQGETKTLNKIMTYSLYSVRHKHYINENMTHVYWIVYSENIYIYCTVTHIVQNLFNLHL